MFSEDRALAQGSQFSSLESILALLFALLSPKALYLYLILLIPGDFQGFLHKLIKCPTSLQQKQVAFNRSTIGTREVYKPGVSCLSTSRESNHIGSSKYLRAGSIPRQATILLGFTIVEVREWRRYVLSIRGNQQQNSSRSTLNR